LLKRAKQHFQNEDGNITSDPLKVQDKWYRDYKHLFSDTTKDSDHFDNAFLSRAKEVLHDYDNENTPEKDVSNTLNAAITEQEISAALTNAKKGKSPGIDNLPVEVFQNATCTRFLLSFFNTCFNNGYVPKEWRRNIITPIPKGSSTKEEEPLSYRALHLMAACGKLYCYILNSRLIKWCNENNKIRDEQNGFRAQRSCMDHIFTLSSIADDRIIKREKLFAAFIDARKAFDRVDRNLLWYRLTSQGVNGKFLASCRAMYHEFECAIRLKGSLTEWFSTSLGVKQGCLISPGLFTIYVNSLLDEIEASGIGAKCDNKVVGALMYADDLVLLADNRNDMQSLLNILHGWCQRWRIDINQDKSKVVVFRHNSSKISMEKMHCGNMELEYTDSYKYLGLNIKYNLDWKHTIDYLAASANRALGSLIAKK
jgi:hypothetical protein